MEKSKVLVVDDDPVSLVLLSKLLEQLDCAVATAADGKQALALLEAQRFDLVVADYEMPEINGLQLLTSIKKSHPELPFILVTAYGNLKVIREAWSAGAFDFFQKPVFVDRLNQTVKLALKYGHLSIARREFPAVEESQPDPELLNVAVLDELLNALNPLDVDQIVDEFETHVFVELEQLLRFAMAHQPEQVRALAHRMAGTATNLGMEKFTQQMRAIEANPEAPIEDPRQLEVLLTRSLHWLKHRLNEMPISMPAAA